MSESLGEKQRAGSNTLEVSHFLAEGDGERAINNVFEEFERQNPAITVEPSAYSTTYGLEIKSRILGENPPDVFMIWPGQDLEPYYRAGAVMDLTELWERNRLEDVFIDGVQDLVQFDGEYAAIPMDIHRKNNIFYNVTQVEDLGVDPRRIGDPREFLEVLAQCEDYPSVGLVQPMKNPWTTLQLWAQIFIGLFGPEPYEQMSKGEGHQYRSEIQEAVELLDRYVEYGGEDPSFVGMVGANEQFIDGESVFFHQGDWVAGEYVDIDGYDYGTDWDHIPFPGTDDYYVMGMDAMTASPETQLPDVATSFLEVAASADAQEALNRAKGSIPPRRDVSMDRYPKFHQDQYEQFKRARAHPGGQKSQVTPEGFVEVRSAFASFAATRDVEATTDAVVEAYEPT